MDQQELVENEKKWDKHVERSKMSWLATSMWIKDKLSFFNQINLFDIVEYISIKVAKIKY